MVAAPPSSYTGGMAPSRNEPRKPRPVTREWLFRAAAYYLGRYASTAENLRRVLERKVASRIGDWGDDPKAPRFIRTMRAAGYMLINPDAG